MRFPPKYEIIISDIGAFYDYNISLSQVGKYQKIKWTRINHRNNIEIMPIYRSSLNKKS